MQQIHQKSREYRFHCVQFRSRVFCSVLCCVRAQESDKTLRQYKMIISEQAFHVDERVQQQLNTRVSETEIV